MQDRVSQNPGRVLITPEDGSAPFYATMTRADNPTVEGTKINKNALLKDTTAALFGLDTNAVPDDIYLAVKAALDEFASALAVAPKIATGSYTGNGKYGSSNKNTITFGFAPQLVIVFAAAMGHLFGNDNYYASRADTLLAARPATSVDGKYAVNVNGVVSEFSFTWGTNSFSWYIVGTEYVSAQAQLNASKTTYYYVALGT